MKIFDVVGAAAVAAWLTLVGAYAWHFYQAAEVERRSLEEGVPIQAGDSWMMLTRDDDEIGFIHETRTAIDGGWLVEYDFMVNVSSLGTAQLLRTKFKATMDEAAVLQRATVSVKTASAMSFEGEAEVRGNDVVLTYELGGQKRNSTVTLQKPPRLSQSAFFQLASMPSLEPGTVFEQEYFDPMVMGMTKMRFRYVRRHQVDVYDQKVDAFHFRQEVGNNEFDVYMDARGEVYIQELPLRIIGARVPPEFGQTRAKALEREFRERNDPSSGVSIDDAVGMLRGEGGLEGTNVYTVTGIPASLAIVGDSPSQRVVGRKTDTVVIDTSLIGDVVVPESTVLEELKVPDPRFDALAWGATLETPDDAIAGQKAEQIGRAVRDAKIQPLSDDAFGRAELAVEGIRRMGIPCRLVYGLRFSKDKITPNYWAQYFDGNKFIDLDPNRPTMLVGTDQVQLGAAKSIDRAAFEADLQKLHVERAPVPQSTTAPADFN